LKTILVLLAMPGCVCVVSGLAQSDQPSHAAGNIDTGAIYGEDVFFNMDISRHRYILSWLVGAFSIGCFALCIRWGLRQKREADGTWRQLVGVSAFVTVLWSLPFIVAAAMIRFGYGHPPGAVWWIFIGIFAFFYIRGTMKPPNLTYVGKEALPECDSPEMLARIGQLSKRIGVATPTVRTQRAMNHASDSAAAFVGGLAPHSIVLYDTILSQLRDDEQDAIIGHELGHVANRSIWVYSAFPPLTTSAMVILSFLGGGAFGVMAGSALRVGIFRLLSRWFEYDCDRRAALATSPDAASRGLRRIYARHVLGKSGLLTDIVHSTSTHPSLNERIHALHELASSGAAGDGQPVAVSYDAGRVALCRKLVVVFALIWLCLTVYGITATLVIGDSLIPMLALFAAVSGPFVFIMLASRRALRIARIRMTGRWRWSNLTLRRRFGVVSLAGVVVLMVMLGVWPESVAPDVPGSNRSSALLAAVAMMISLVGIIIGFSGPTTHSGKNAKLAQAITGAVQRNDFDGVIEICKDNYDIVKHDKQLRYSGAAALLATRQVEKFIPYCEKIRGDFPHFPPPAISLATVYVDHGEPEKALQALRDIENDLHKVDPLPAVMSSRALVALGQLDEAKRQSDRGLELAPDDVSAMAQAALVAMAMSDFDEADRLIEQGNDLLPAEPLLIVARGERAILNDDLVALQTERDTLETALTGDRLLNLYGPLARFDESLSKRSADNA
jgi:Zn-dependent protease with chaperone function